jgi:hypothetical protein
MGKNRIINKSAGDEGFRTWRDVDSKKQQFPIKKSGDWINYILPNQEKTTISSQSWKTSAHDITNNTDQIQYDITYSPFQIYIPGFVTEMEETLKMLENLQIKVYQPDEVRKYFGYYPDLIIFVKNACNLAKVKFQSEAQLSLQIVKDPEYPEESLVLFIRQYDYSTNFLEQLDEFRMPIQQKMQGQPGIFDITTDFQDPISYEL